MKISIDQMREKLEQNSMPITECGCLVWMKSTNEDGYGQSNWNGKASSAHRISWRVHKGEIPLGMHVLHRCDVRPCINPDHLFLGTHLENMRDRASKKRGADFSGEKNPRTILTEKDVLEIFNSIGPAAVLAEKFNINRGTVYSIRNGHNWQNLTGQFSEDMGDGPIY